MPLFDSIERDVADFFVSQGSVFDALVKSFMDRMTQLEFRVDSLRSDVTLNFQSVSSRIDANSVAAAEVSAVTAAAAASAAIAALPVAECTSSPVTTVVDGGRNDELEYYVMTLSRQLNMVLEALFQPHESNVVEVVQTKQGQLHTISDVLTENEAILMQLAMQHDELKMTNVEEISGVDAVSALQKVIAAKPTTDEDPKPSDQPRQTSSFAQQQPALEIQDSVKELPQQQFSLPPASSTLEESTATAAVSDQKPPLSNPQVIEEKRSSPVEQPQPQQVKHVETISPQFDASPLTAKEEVVRKVSMSIDNQSNIHAPDDDEDNDDDEKMDQMSLESSFRPAPSHLEGIFHRKKSFFRSCQELRLSEEERLREQRRREEELMRRMHELLLQSRANLQHDPMDPWRSQQDEINTKQQVMIEQLQEQIQGLLQAQEIQLQGQQLWREHQDNQTQEWHRQQDKQRQSDIASINRDVERKLEAFSSLLAAAQATQGHELAQALQLLNDRFISQDALKAAGELWLKTAADNCIYGADAEALSALQHEFLEFQKKMNSLTIESPAMSLLHEAIARVIQLLQQTTSPESDVMKGPEQENTMYTLRQLLAKADTSYRSVAEAHDGAQLPDVKFIAEVIHRMELGTANLLDAIDFQQEHFQQTLAQHQTGRDKLQKELWRQQEVEKTLKLQLGTCPSKEDTLRLVQELRDQVTATTADSTSRMLDTVEDLRYRMAGLPNIQMLEQLAHDLHSKADRINHELGTTADKLTHDLRLKLDRSEIDRLQSLLEANNGSGGLGPCLTKSPLRCLSCDQHLPFAQAPPEDADLPESPTSPPRSPSNSPPRSIVYPIRQPQHFPHQHAYVQPAHTYENLGINMGLLEELFAASSSALERRRRQRQRLQMQLSRPQPDENGWGSQKPMFMNIDDGRNRIPLRKTQLSDQVIYGPAITPHSFRKKQLDRPDDGRNMRPKTAALPERRPGGEIITRTVSSTVIVRPFAELTDKRLQKK